VVGGDEEIAAVEVEVLPLRKVLQLDDLRIELVRDGSIVDAAECGAFEASG
jgi:hypothetical protein